MFHLSAKKAQFLTHQSTARSIQNLRAYQGGLWEHSAHNVLFGQLHIPYGHPQSVPVEVRLGRAAHLTLDKISGLRLSDHYMEHQRGWSIT